MMKHSAMLEALHRNKARGLDMVVLMHPGAAGLSEGDPQEEAGETSEDEAKELNLAPDATQLGDEREAHDEQLAGMAPHDNMEPGGEIINHPGEMAPHELMAHTLAKAGMGKRSIAHRATLGGGKDGSVAAAGGHGPEGHGAAHSRHAPETHAALTKRKV